MACSLLLKTKRVSSATSTTTRRRVTRALVNVDFGPAMLLGSGMVASGLALYQVRVVRPEVSKDYDIMFASVALLCGGILIFQGWRLDPLLLFGQILTAGAAVTFAAEAVKLRGQVSEDLQAQIERERGGDRERGGGYGLPGQEQAGQQEDPYNFQNQNQGSDNFDRRYQDDASFYAYSGATSSSRSRPNSQDFGGGERGYNPATSSASSPSYPSDINRGGARGAGNSNQSGSGFVEFETQQQQRGYNDYNDYNREGRGDRNQQDLVDDGFYRYEDDDDESYNNSSLDQDDFTAYDVNSDWD